jgi:hypothetical protein
MEIKLIWAFEVHRSRFYYLLVGFGTKNVVFIGLNYFYFTAASVARLSIAHANAVKFNPI